MISHLSLSLIVFSMTFCPSTQENHYCLHGESVTVQIDDYYNRDETIVPMILGESIKGQRKPKQCRWDIRLKTANPGMQLVIAAVPSKKDRSTTADGEAKMSVNFFNRNSAGFNVTTGMFQVLPATGHRRFTVDLKWDPVMQKPSSDNLRILLPIPRQCGRDMLWFSGSCYAVSAVRQSMADATDSVGGDSQLASFSSMAEISEFIAANTERLNEFPYRRPLSLRQPVRLGMFLNASAATVLTVVRSDSGCVLKSKNILATGREKGPCLSLRVTESDRAVVQFGDCGSPMLSLLSFPETSRSVLSSAAHCSGSEVATLLDRLQSRFADAESSPEFSAQRKNSSSSGGYESFFQKNQAFIYPAIIVGALSLIAVFVVLAFAMKLRRRRRLKYLLNYQRQESKQQTAGTIVMAANEQRQAVSDNVDRNLDTFDDGYDADDDVSERCHQADYNTEPALHTSYSIDSLDLLAAANRPLLRQQEDPGSLSSTLDHYLAGGESSEDFSDLVPNLSDRFRLSDSKSLSSSLLDSAVGGASGEPSSNSRSASNVSRPEPTEQQEDEKPDYSPEDQSELPPANNTETMLQLWRRKIDQSGDQAPFVRAQALKRAL